MQTVQHHHCLGPACGSQRRELAAVLTRDQPGIDTGRRTVTCPVCHISGIGHSIQLGAIDRIGHLLVIQRTLEKHSHLLTGDVGIRCELGRAAPCHQPRIDSSQNLIIVFITCRHIRKGILSSSSRYVQRTHDVGRKFRTADRRAKVLACEIGGHHLGLLHSRHIGRRPSRHTGGIDRTCQPGSCSLALIAAKCRLGVIGTGLPCQRKSTAAIGSLHRYSFFVQVHLTGQQLIGHLGGVKFLIDIRPHQSQRFLGRLSGGGTIAHLIIIGHSHRLIQLIDIRIGLIAAQQIDLDPQTAVRYRSTIQRALCRSREILRKAQPVIIIQLDAQLKRRALPADLRPLIGFHDSRCRNAERSIIGQHTDIFALACRPLDSIPMHHHQLFRFRSGHLDSLNIDLAALHLQLLYLNTVILDGSGLFSCILAIFISVIISGQKHSTALIVCKVYSVIRPGIGSEAEAYPQHSRQQTDFLDTYR